MALTKAEMAERLYEDVGLNKREAKEFVDAFFDALREALEHGRQVKLSGFGNFDLRRKNQRPGRKTRAISAKQCAGSGTTARIRCSTALSKLASAKGRRWASP